jgi:hypothetical protein
MSSNFKNQGAYGCRCIFNKSKSCNILRRLQIQLNLGNVGYHICCGADDYACPEIHKVPPDNLGVTL